MTITRKHLLGSTAVMVALSPLVALQQAAQAASVSVPAQVIMNSALALTPNDSLNFGTLTLTPAGGTVQLGFTDNVTKIGGNFNPAGGTVTSGNVTMKLTPGLVTKVSTTTATYKISALGGGAGSKTMTLSNINYRVGTKIGPNLTFTPGAGTNTLDIGADLKTSGPQVQGTYIGNIKLMVNQF
jgi:hypothetical protein